MKKFEEEELKNVSGGESQPLLDPAPKYQNGDPVKCLSAMDLGTGRVFENKYSFREQTYYYNVGWPGRSDWIREDDLIPSSDPWG